MVVSVGQAGGEFASLPSASPSTSMTGGYLRSIFDKLGVNGRTGSGLMRSLRCSQIETTEIKSLAPQHDAAWELCRGLRLLSSRAPRGQLDLCRAQDAYDRGDSRRKRRWIGDGRLRWPLDQYGRGRVGRLDELYDKSIGSTDRSGRQEPI